MLVLLRFAGAILGGAMLVSCTRGVVDENPVAPTPTGPTLRRITITPISGGTLIVGASTDIITSGGLPTSGVVFGALAEFSDGSAHYVNATWTSSNPSVVSVANNTLTAMGLGTALVTATFQGHSDDAPFEVMGGITGSWAGTYVVEQCIASSGSLSEVMCLPPATGRQAGFAHVGATLPIAMELTENGTAVTGAVSFGGLRGTLTGTSRASAFFALTGTIAGAGVQLKILHWDTLVQRDVMQGFINYEVRISSLPGIGSVGIRLVNLTRLAPP